ncbi:hypothetical protein AB6A40_007701 [Gnathostoma spinigerum]|uniref:Choline/carnitine acyltransferase domain-containing protein n=1 Tax=Gnathostoma spinigerum TaxID=75299 RepID=A0ABD6EWN6_9BILA
MSTFSHQKSLPPLPLPDLNVTLDKYLKSVEVFLSVSEFQKTRETVEKFRHSKLAHQLQNILVHRAANHRNWLDEWWYDAYNEVRLPLTPYSNQAATSDLWAPNERAWLHRAADFIHHVMQFWISIRKYVISVLSFVPF